jgi:transcriptional repressor NrdR
MEAPRLFVVKKDGRREQYNRDKILNGLRRACEKRPVSEAQMEEIVASLERSMFTRGESEVQSTLVGEKLMEALKAVDPVAYIRFASVADLLSK